MLAPRRGALLSYYFNHFYIATFYNHKVLNKMSFSTWSLVRDDVILFIFHYTSPYWCRISEFLLPRIVFSTFFRDLFTLPRTDVGFRVLLSRNVFSTIFRDRKRIGMGGIRTADLPSVELQRYPLDHDAPLFMKSFNHDWNPRKGV